MASVAGAFSTVPARPNGALDVQTANTSSQSSVEKSNTTLREQQAGAPANNGSSASGEDFDTDFELNLQGTTGSDWTPDELVVLESALARFPADKYAPVERYIHVAASLPSKTARDVALRVKACGLDDKGRRGGAVDDSSKRKAGGGGSQARAGAMQGCKGAGGAANGSGNGTGAAGSGDDSSPGVPAVMTQLMEQNYGILNQFKSNMAAFKVMENTELLVRYRDNLMAIQQQLSSIGGTMGQMPPIPVQPNFDLANKWLPAGTLKPQPVGAQAGAAMAPAAPPAAAMSPVAMPPAMTAPAGAAATTVGAVAPPAAAPMPGLGMAVGGAPPAAAAAPAAAAGAPPVGALPGVSPVPPAMAAPTPMLPMMPPFPFNPAVAAAGLANAGGIPPVMPPMDSFFGAAAGMPGALGVMPPPLVPGALNPAAAAGAAAMGAGMPGAQFPFGMGTQGMLGCMPMAGTAMPAPVMPDGGAAAVAAAAAAAAAAAQQAAMPSGMQSSMTSAPSMSRQGSAVQPVNVPIVVKQESGA
ncbi:hypothetical protein PLESTB_000499200 [Pleodorina starrii]|uniref:Uncharacterized protein n=1 Tax=Pleodorina starrii TaxID=330485 RepID=A0A9W6BGK4_9CHLO|nr:hypothetical protein PLESTM_000370600 [Pleodorina starrii]GLC51410.1 hypothetical protein PLESTB_000499200 [Pleodorina starrii]GLC63775.1 hypothetical protein PLESTF_000072700 [Pleodorina starrii]